MKMDMAALFFLTDLFYGNGFTLAQAEKLYGPVADDKEDTIELTPIAGSNAATVTLEKLKISPDAPPFLAGIRFAFKVPPLVDFAAIVKRFGPEVELPRLKPQQEIPCRFLIQDAAHSGYMLCVVPPVPEVKEPQRKVTKLILRRFPKD